LLKVLKKLLQFCGIETESSSLTRTPQRLRSTATLHLAIALHPEASLYPDAALHLATALHPEASLYPDAALHLTAALYRAKMSLIKGVNYFTANDENFKKMSITDFYNNQEIFITGGSGFIGKALIEKLLRSFPNFNKMFILLRPKNGKSVDERLQELLDNIIFQRARDEQPESFKKIHAIAGDCKELGLGISSDDLRRIKNVTIIFHSAANVRFDNPFKESVFVNLRGTHEIIKIAETMPKLIAFVQVSTLYANVDQIHIKEQMRSSDCDWRTTIKLAETLDGKTLDILFKKYSSDHPNTYTLAKSLGEQIVNDYRNKLPVIIYRVAQMVNSVEEPLPGWIDNMNGPAALFLSGFIGVGQSFYIGPYAKLNMIPCDVTVHGLIISAYALVTKPNFLNNSNESVDVLNNCLSSENLMSQEEITHRCHEVAKENPSEKAIWFTGGTHTTCWIRFFIHFMLTQFLLANLLDCILRLRKEKPFFVKLQRRIYSANMIVQKFINTNWITDNDKYESLSTLITEEDKNKLNLQLDYKFSKRHARVFLEGYKKFILKEPVKASKQAILRFKIFYFLHYFLMSVMVLCLLWFIKKLIPLSV
uniref:Fatty acyl-CoA reductase n=1 Tax=Glossina austeni TaxID=7395 RepID=A0A1A9VCH2_GLOAU